MESLPEEILEIILAKAVDRGSTYKAVRLTCRILYTAANRLYPHGDEDFADHIATLLYKLPDADWNYGELSRHASWTAVQSVNANWNYSELSEHIPCKIIRDNPNNWWDYGIVGRYNKTYKPGVFGRDKRDDEATSNLRLYTCSFPKSEEELVGYLWPFYSTSCPLDLILKTADKPWNWIIVSRRSDITWDIVQSNPTIPWSYNALSLNPTITIDIIRNNQDKPWRYADLSSVIPWKDMIANPDLPWVYSWALNNLSREEFISMMGGFNAAKRSSYRHLTWKIVAENWDLGWDMYALSQNRFGRNRFE